MHGRVTLRNFVADYLATGHGKGKAAVIAAFVSPAEEDWRFSFIRLDFTLETTELGFVTERKQLTPARRYSYLVGTGENCHTAQKQFLELLQADQSDPTVARLEASFGVEKVTKEFFEQYRDLFEKTRTALGAFLKSVPAVVQDFDQRGITIDDFAKKLLGQIVFLYFLQKKGWFGVERGKPWGTGRKDFIRHLYEERSSFASLPAKKGGRDSNFFNDILEPLFYDALSRPRLEEDHYYPGFDCRIPFLNGGLFEPLYGYKWVETDILLPDSLFSNNDETGEGDKGTGILDVFDRYNFTVNEAEPLEREVAVDPEMLGKVFENLLSENIRHAGGTYYTPRTVVHYMCQQALLQYLTTRATDIPSDDLALFLRLAERFADFEATETKAHADKRLPATIGENAARLDELLAAVTVCDPAIGSGAFPVGMMHEIVRARLALSPALARRDSDSTSGPRTAYAFKRHAIHHSLYGVDEDPGAVEIAKLRLWLSMVVDEEEFGDIQPLPNLDYKIMQGNSLLEEFDGIPLFNENLLQSDVEDRPSPRLTAIDERQAFLHKELMRLQAIGKLTRKVSDGLKNEGSRLAKEKKALLSPPNKSNASHPELGLGSRGSLNRLQQLHAEYFEEASRAKKERLRSELDRLEWDFMRATLQEQGHEDALVQLERASAKHRKPFFLWRLHFAEIFHHSGGFDIVIANPPYVRMELFKDHKPALKRRFPDIFAGRADLYVYFYGLALAILRDGGCLAFISSNTYLNAKFGEDLRRHLLEVTSIVSLIDFAETKVFDAVVEPAIIVLSKNATTEGVIRFVKWQESQTLDDLPEVAGHRAQRVLQSSFSKLPWRLIGGAEARLMEQFARGQPLGKLAADGILYGVKTGLNEAFIIDEAKRIELFADPQSAEIIKPFIRGRDIARWVVQPIQAWLIYTYHGVDIKKYPLIERHLRPFKDRLEARATEQEWFELQQPQFRYSKLFAKPKVVYQDISRTYAFAYDTDGCYCGDTTFVLPTSSPAITAVLQSSALRWGAHVDQGVPFGGFLRLKAQYMERCPIPAMEPREEETLTLLVEYLLFLNRTSSENTPPTGEPNATLFAGFFEQLVNALVYELFFPEAIHAAGLHFFELVWKVDLDPIGAMKKGSELALIGAKFEALYHPTNPIRQGMFALDSIEEVRIIEGKA